jgi:hypothetical protein
MIIDLDAERGRISLSTKQLEPEPGDMVKNPDLVFDKAEEMAEKYREQLRKEVQLEVAEPSWKLFQDSSGPICIFFPAKCFIDSEVDLRVTFSISQSQVRDTDNESSQSIFISAFTTAPSFDINQKISTLELKKDGLSYAGEVILTLIPRELDKQIVEIEFFRNSFRVGYYLLETEILTSSS